MATLLEELRLLEDEQRKKNWKRWGPYLAERQWGTVREDYSADGEAWRYFPHDQARSRAYRWGEDGLLGLCDREGRLCFALALWNGKDPILKERLFGLANHEGNHGEDVKEAYFYLDNTPTHSYMKALYKYPQAEFPYARLVEENARRSRLEPEFDVEDSGVFDDNRYFDVFIEYAKASPNDILIRITAENRGPDAAPLHLLPTLWFKNTWSWGRTGEGYWAKPRLTRAGEALLAAEHETLGRFTLAADGRPRLLFTENETNAARLFGAPNREPYVKDAFHERVVHSNAAAVNPAETGTKAAAWHSLTVPAGGSQTIRLRLFAEEDFSKEPFGPAFDQVFAARRREADDYHAQRLPVHASEQDRLVARRANAGLLWSKQFYSYAVQDWLDGDPGQPAPPVERFDGRNADWKHLYNRDVVAMPDKWEYPWYAAWDHAFQMVPFARLDPGFAKDQLVLFMREWYMHPSGQLPAYEYSFSDANPPVHAWACWRVFKMTGERGVRDRRFLARTFSKLLLNFTWWVNRKDREGRHLFSGGFLGLDNIGVFDRSKPLPTGGHIEQADATAWMAFYSATMLGMAFELGRDGGERPEYGDIASKFFEHFLDIAEAINTFGGTGLWDEEDGFYYDQLHVGGVKTPLKIRSMVGLIPLLAVELIEHEDVENLPGFSSRMDWLMAHKPDLARFVSCMVRREGHQRCLLAAPTHERLLRILKRLFDEEEFLSPFGIRSLSKYHEAHPYVFSSGGRDYHVRYVPGESESGSFGGNSNWRGPIWFPLNYLLIDALQTYHHFYGGSFLVEFPTGSKKMVTLKEAAREVSRRLVRLFHPGEGGCRPFHSGAARLACDAHWKDLVLFHEYYDAETGRGLGAAHQTGWTALVARLIEDLCEKR